MFQSALLAAAVLASNVLAGPVAFRAAWNEGALRRYRVACTEYNANGCVDFVHALNTGPCGSFQQNWQAYWTNTDYGREFVFDVNVVKGAAGAGAITCAINKVTGQGAYGDYNNDLACDNYPHVNNCMFNGIHQSP